MYLRDYSVLSLDLLRVELVVKLARFIQTLVLPSLSGGYQQFRCPPFLHVFLMGNKINSLINELESRELKTLGLGYSA